MADLTKSAGALIAEVRESVSKELLESLRPIGVCVADFGPADPFETGSALRGALRR